MESIQQLLEEELSDAVEVKNPQSAHRFILLLTENSVARHEYSDMVAGVRSDLKDIITVMRERFEAVDKRFEYMQASMDKRFSSLQWTMGLGFTILVILISVFNYV